MFICQKCGHVSEPRSPMRHLVVETRPRVYERRNSEVGIRVSHGSEIVRELRVCDACAGHETKSTPRASAY